MTSLLLACHFKFYVKSINPMKSYDVISVFEDDGYRVGNLLPALVLITALV